MGQFRLDQNGLNEFIKELNEFIKNMSFNVNEMEDTIKYCRNYFNDKESSKSIECITKEMDPIKNAIKQVISDRDYLIKLSGGMNQ